MLKAYQYRLYPTSKQRHTFEAQLSACQTLYNQALDMRKQQYERDGVTTSYNTQAGMLTQLRKQSPFWSSLHIDTLQDTLRRLDKAYKAFFRRVKKGEKPGFPRFKARGRYRSVTYSHISKKLIRGVKGRLARLVVPKVGLVKIRLHRALPDGKIKNLTIRRKASGWYACIGVETPDVPKVEAQSAVGVDVGLLSFLTTSEGDKVDNPRHLRQSQAKLKRKQRRVSKRNKGSQRRRKAVHELARQHERVANQRLDFHCKTAHSLYSEYDTVVVEDLRIANMVKNHHLALSISDAAWGHFTLALASKAESAGKHLLFVPPHGTSQKCSGCGQTVKKSLKVRVHRCHWCGLELDRDHNAAINIKRAASALRGGVLKALNLTPVNSPDEARNSRSGGLRREVSRPQAPAFMRG